MIAKVILGTMTNARKLVSIAERISCDVELCSGRYVVNAKSMLGVLSMPKFEYGELHIHTDEENECNQVLERLLEEGLLADTNDAAKRSLYDITTFGEILIDFTWQGVNEDGQTLFAQNPGGAPANVAVAVAKLGGHTAFIGKAGKDMHGEFLKSVLEKENVETEGMLLDEKYFTTLAFVNIDENGERTFSFARKPGADTRMEKEEIDVDILDKTHIFHVGSLSLTEQPARDTTHYAIRRAKEKGVNCPFGAIADKGQIYQLIQGFNRGDRIYALVAPAFINQFPGLASTGKLKAALKAVGFYDVVEVAIGADLCTVDEAHDFLEEVPEKLDFMATSCCPAWSMMAKTAFPGLAKNISMTMTPMVFTARMMKQKDPEARMCFIGPCAAKKLEASRRTVRSDVDFVLTFEELAGIIEAKDVDTSLLEVDEAEALHAASAAGRGFAQSGGVAKAVADKIKEWHPDMDVKIASAQGLAECKKLLMLAKAGKYNGYLLEGMGCPGGCIGGAGTIADPARTAIQLNKYVKEAPFTDPEQSAFMTNIHVLKDDPNFEV